MSKNIDLAKGEGHLRPNENNSLRLLSLTFWRLPSLPAKVRPVGALGINCGVVWPRPATGGPIDFVTEARLVFLVIMTKMSLRTLCVVERLVRFSEDL